MKMVWNGVNFYYHGINNYIVIVVTRWHRWWVWFDCVVVWSLTHIRLKFVMMDGVIDTTFWHNATYYNHVYKFGDFSSFFSIFSIPNHRKPNYFALFSLTKISNKKKLFHYDQNTQLQIIFA
jgi:hypothetical protein